MLKKLLKLVILCSLLAAAAGARQSNQGSRTWAVVIGISKYQKLPGGQQLQFADRDASLFAEAIQKRGVSPQNVRLLTGADATTAAIKSAVGNWLARSVSESDTVLIFFSGHGLFEREFGESYLLGYDSDPKDPYGTALSLSEVGQALARRVRSGRVLVMADAVRRDFFDPESDPNSSKSFEQSFDQLTTSRPGVSVIIASGPGEFSREGQRWGGHGVFAKHLADVLIDGADRNGDLAITADELFALLKGRVADDTAGKQHPFRIGSAFTQSEIARVQRQNPPAAAPTADAVPKATRPDLAVSPKPAGDTNGPDAGSQPGQKKDVVVAPVKSAAPGQTAGMKSATQTAGGSAPVEKQITKPAAPPSPPVSGTRKESAPAKASDTRLQPVPTSTDEKKSQPGLIAGNKSELPPVAGRPERTDPNPAPSSREAGKPGVTVPAGSEKTAGSNSAPKPPVNPPRAVAVSSERTAGEPETRSSAIPAALTEAAPSPLVLQLEVAIASKTLIEPKNGGAWDLYQRMVSAPDTAADAARLKPWLAEALTAQGRSIVSGDVRGDNISDRVDDFKRAGQMLARARTLMPDSGEVSALEKLSAAEALISLQFYDEAERALAPLQTAKLAAVENALGLVYQGKLDTWRAERAFKRASELDLKWAAPHYNLAMLYRSQQNQAALGEFEAAASSDQSNVTVLAALGEEYFTRQQWKQAADTYRKAVALNPSDDNLHTKLGHALYSQGLQDEANREYQKAGELRRKKQ